MLEALKFNEIAGMPGGEEIVNQVFPNFWVLVAHLLATVVVLSILVRFVWKPMKKNLGDRTTYIQTAIDGSQKLEREAEMHFKEAEEKIRNANGRADVIVEDGKKEAFDLIEKARDRANKLAKKITTDADIAIQQQRRKMEAEMKQEVVEMSVAIAEKLVADRISKQDAESMVADFIKKDNK